MSRVFWDTNLFIYLLEDHGELADRVETLLARMKARGDQLYTSVLTLGEVLTRPLRENRMDLAAKYEATLSPPFAVLAPFDRGCARHYALLRQDKSIRAPDALQLACAAHLGCDLFITNDDRLSRKVVPGIQFISSLERAFL